MSSRKEQKEQARQAREAKEQEMAAKAARSRRLWIIGGVVAVAAIAVVIAVVASGSGGNKKVQSSEITKRYEGIPQSGITLGEPGIKANSIALHTRELKQDELPVILPEEE